MSQPTYESVYRASVDHAEHFSLGRRRRRGVDHPAHPSPGRPQPPLLPLVPGRGAEHVRQRGGPPRGGGHGERTALIYDSAVLGVQHITYAQLQEEGRPLAGARGPGCGQRPSRVLSACP
ncbi:hypothetical protein QJS66_05970 [Kocuria rhizophila]|nr:hypothetical protein QJS66_05970 [Kocuria rhizophila]